VHITGSLTVQRHTFIYVCIDTVLIVIVLFFRMVKRKERELEESFQKRFSGQKIVYMSKYAQLVAQESRGYSQTKGMGYLVLTDQELHFSMQLVDLEISIPATALTRVGETRRMKGKGTIKLMLKVEFKTLDGKDDALALRVKDMARWKAELAGVMGKEHSRVR
jgi:hypothetical protein